MMKHLPNLGQMHSVIDQILLSLASLIVSYVVLSKAGIEIFGVYSFIIVICNLISGGVHSFLHGQMILRISGKRKSLMQSTFRATCIIFLFQYAILVVVGILVWTISGGIGHLQGHSQALGYACIYTCLLCIFELFRKYTYVVAQQLVSLRSTVLFFSMMISGLIVFEFDEQQSLVRIFQILCVSKVLALCINSLCIKAFYRGRSISGGTKVLLFKKYWLQGRYSLMGMFTSWIQNQGITPLLMFLAGPLIVGYFNLARLLTVPIVVVNTGLINSALPRLRETYIKASNREVRGQVRKFTVFNLALSSVYIIALCIGHFTGLLEKVFSDYRHATTFLLIWCLVTIALVFRSWLTQTYVVAMKFKFLLAVGVVSALFTYLMIFITYAALKDYFLLPASVLFGELFLIGALLYYRDKILLNRSGSSG